jgi:hypothetical protein
VRLTALYRKHQIKVRLLEERMRTSALALVTTLEHVARAIDEYMVRRSRC